MVIMQELKVTKNDAGQRMDKLLGKFLSKAPKSFYYKMLRKKNITLNGKKADGSEKLVEDDVIRFYLSDDTIAMFKGEAEQEIKVLENVSGTVDVLYEDANVIIVNKPAGMLSQKAEKQDVSLVEHILSYLLEHGSLSKEELSRFRPGVCNRLDRNTSGIIIAGKSLLGLQKMSEIIKDRSLKKYYRCIVVGKMTKKEHITGYLYKEEASNKVTVWNEKEMEAFRKKQEQNSKAAFTSGNKNKENILDQTEWIETEYEPIASTGEYTLLEVKLITGKTHQIRAHLASIGHPIIGDFKYGKESVNQKLKKAYALKSQLLHAYRIVLPKMDGEFAALSEKEIIAKVPVLFEQIQEQLWKKE